ncbi:MAG: radical SAM protein [Candidatus Thermoplasmatota archaeon]
MENERVINTLQHRFQRKISIEDNFGCRVDEPYPHVLVSSKKELHGWYYSKEPLGRRECTAERLLINPYAGCAHNCFFCYANAYKGYFERYRKEGIVTVFKDFDKVIAQQLDSLNIASCGYLSPVTDPFQPINKKYELAEKITSVFISRNIPIEFITKGKVPNKIISLIKTQQHSFGQISILTLDEELRKKLVPNGASTEILLKNLANLKNENIYAVARIDPIFPYITDSEESLKELVNKIKDCGANHVIASVLDIPKPIQQDILKNLDRIVPGITRKYLELYTERIGYYLHANIAYRKKIFKFLREFCKASELTFALCMEFELVRRNKKQYYRGLNQDFATSINCEGLDVPIYMRKNDEFQPVNCKGDCLTCNTAACGIEELKSAKAWKLRDYKRWSKLLGVKRLEEF